MRIYMLDWTNEDSRLTPETQQMLSQLPLTKAFLGPYLDQAMWAINIAPELKNIRSLFKANQEKLDNTTTIAAFFGLNSGILNSNLPENVILTTQEILLYLGFEAFLQKVDREKYGPISTLIMSRLREIGLINEDVLMDKQEEILHWYDTSWKIGYALLPSLIGQSPSEDKKIDQPPQPDKPTDSGKLDLGPFADFIDKKLPDL
jgi:hypothetical protein